MNVISRKKAKYPGLFLGDVFLTLFLRPAFGSFWEECVSH